MKYAILLLLLSANSWGGVAATNLIHLGTKEGVYHYRVECSNGQTTTMTRAIVQDYISWKGRYRYCAGEVCSHKKVYVASKACDATRSVPQDVLIPGPGD